MAYFTQHNGVVSQEDFIARLSRFYADFMGNWQTMGYCFYYGNNSLVMNFVSGFLRMAGLQGISHSGLDGDMFTSIVSFQMIRVSMIREGKDVEFDDPDHPPIYTQFHNVVMAAQTQPADHAMSPGGIDLDGKRLDIMTKITGTETAFNMDPAMLQRMQNAPGVTPVIMGIQPLDSLSQFLGVKGASAQPVGG